MKINGKKWYIIGSFVITLIVGVMLSLTLGLGAINSTEVEDIITAGGRVRAMSISASTKQEVVINKTATSATYNAEPIEYDICGTHADIGGFEVKYLVSGIWTTEAPINYTLAGYKVRITRAEDDVYQAYDSGEFVGLHIQKKPVNLVVKDYVVTYGDKVPSYEVEVVDMQGNPGLEGTDTIFKIYQQHNPVFDCDYTPTANVGEYDITLTNYHSFTPMNYAVNDAFSGKVTVNPATIKYHAESYYGYYDGEYHGIDVKLENVEEAHICYSFDTDTAYLDELKLREAKGQQKIYFKIIKQNYVT
ncbi:MAG: hypothetical protein J6V40_05130, partial [Clostridia bacterium]|nr:hypothetical protein [Clostridia bacterium]